MIILAHRGLWARKLEQNSISSLCEAMRHGFGVETDLRDEGGRLVISHDCPSGSAPTFEQFLDRYCEMKSTQMLALNIKASGLHALVENTIARYGISKSGYFLFDMAPPDALGYLARSMPCFTRQSEIEAVPAFIDSAAGIWLDCFYTDWIDESVIRPHCVAGRRVALVSPELHGRKKSVTWPVWRDALKRLRRDGYADRIMICTDYPLEAEAYFNGED